MPISAPEIAPPIPSGHDVHGHQGSGAGVTGPEAGPTGYHAAYGVAGPPPAWSPVPPGGYATGGYPNGGYPNGGYPNGGYPPPYGPGLQWQVPPPPPVPVVRHTLTTRSWIWAVVVAALVASVFGALIGATVALKSQRTIVQSFLPNTSVIPRPGDIQAILSKVEPAVVSINAESGDGSGAVVQDAGSGMILTSDGEVLTNNHVVAGATTVTVTLFGQSQARAAKVLGTDPSRDLALLMIDNASNLPTVTLGQSSATQVGDSVLAIGNALALAGGPSVTQGIISAENRSLSAQNDQGSTESLSGLLQTDAAINPGNSGGPLVNAQAQVVGMNTAVASSSSGNAPAQNIGFAIPVDSIKPMLAQLRTGGTGTASTTTTTAPSGPTPSPNKAVLGVTVGPITQAIAGQDNLSVTSGALVLAVDNGGPAARAGIQAGDVIVSFDGKTVNQPSDLTSAIGPLRPGDVASVGVVRGTSHLHLSVTLGSNPSTG